jgi:DNA-binding response OmpR family regulator
MSEHVPYCPLPVVLVVENDILERVFKAATLRRQGFEVFEAADVAEAVTVLKKIAVDILISDASLIDGTLLARLAKEHQPNTQVVWMVALQSRQNSVGTAVLH